MDDESDIRKILADCQTWAVVGLSNNTSRAAYGVARFLQGHGKRIVPVHPSAETVHGEQGYATLADIPFPVDCVDVFVRSELAGAIADEAVGINAQGGLVPAGCSGPGRLHPDNRGRSNDGDEPLPGDRVGAAWVRPDDLTEGPRCSRSTPPPTSATRIARQLDDELVRLADHGRKSGTPAPDPVWFLWHDGEILIAAASPDKAKLPPTSSRAGRRSRCNFNATHHAAGETSASLHQVGSTRDRLTRAVARGRGGWIGVTTTKLLDADRPRPSAG